MAIHYEQPQPHISLDRVKEIDLVRDVVECCLCHGLLWYPTACKHCDNAVCSACNQALNATKSEPVCPHGCPSYIERSCPPFIIRILDKLKISCRYELNGCTDILLYTELEEHEKICDYSLLTCKGCQQEIIKKTFDEHQSDCQLLVITCDQCSTSYIRKTKDLHTLIECLHVKLQQQKSKIEQLEKNAVDQQIKIDQIENKLEQSGAFWNGFFLTIDTIKSMFDKPIELIKS